MLKQIGLEVLYLTLSFEINIILESVQNTQCTKTLLV